MSAPPPRVASALSNTHIAARKAEREALARDLAAKLPSHRPVGTKATSSVGQQQGPPLPHRASVTTLSSGPSSFRGDTRRPSLATNGASSNPSSFLLLSPQAAATAHNEGLTVTTLSVSSRPASVSGTSSQQGGGASYAAKAHEKAMAAKVLSSSFASVGRGGRGSEAGSEFGDGAASLQANDTIGTFGALYSSMRSVTSSIGGGGIAPSSPLKRRQSSARRQSAAWMDDEDSVLFDDEPIQAEVVIQLKNGAPRKGEGTTRISKSVSHGASMTRRASSTKGNLPSPSSSPSRQHQRTSSNTSNNNHSLQLDPQEEVSILKARVRYLEAKQQRKDTTQLEGIVGRGGSDFCPPGLLVDPRTGRRFCRLASFPLHTDAPPPWSLPWNSHLLENSLNPLTSASAASAPPLLSFEHLSDAAAEVGVQQSSVPRRGTHLVQSSTPHSPDVYEPPTPSGALAATAKRTQSGVLINQAESTDVAEGAESPLSNGTARSSSFLLRSPDGGVSTAAAGPPAYVLPSAILLTNHNNSSKSSSARRGGSPNQVPRSSSPDAHDSAAARNIHNSVLKPSLQKSDDGENSFMELRGEESASSPAGSDHHNYFHPPTDQQQPLTSSPPLPHIAHSSPPKRSGRSVDDPTFGPRKRSVFFANGEEADLVSPASHPASPSLAAPSPSYYATTGGPLIRVEAPASPDASEGAAGGGGAAAETSLFTPSFGPATHTAGSSSTNSTTNTGGGTTSSSPLISRGAEEQKDAAGVVHRHGATLHGAPSPHEGTTFRGRRLNSFWEPSGDMDGDEGSPRSGSPGYFTLPSAANAPVVVPSPAAAAAPAPIALSETVSFYSMNVRRKAPQAAASTSIQQQQQPQQQQKVLQLEPHVMTVTAPTPPSRSPPPSTATTLQPPSSPPPSSTGNALLSNARVVNGPQQSATAGRQSEASRIEALFPAAPETAASSSTTASNTTTPARASGGASSTPSVPSVQLLQRALQQAQREAEGKESNSSNNCTPVEMEQVCRYVVPAEMQSGFELMDRTRRAQLLEKRIKAVLSRRNK